MNPSVVNRKDIISRFKLRSNTINREVIPVEDTTIDYANNTITHKLKEIPHNLPLSISTRLPSINKSLHNLSETPYIYHLDQVLNSSEPKFKSNKQIQLCIYKVIEKPRSPPFLLYLLNKDAATNILYFPHFFTKKNIMDDARDKIDIIYTDPESTVADALKIMLENKIGAIVIKNNDEIIFKWYLSFFLFDI